MNAVPLSPSRRQIGHRLTVALVSLAMLAVAIFEPLALAYNVVHHAGPLGVWLSWCMAAMSVAALVDVVCNDMVQFPLFRVLAEQRHYGYMGQAAMNFAIIFAMARAESLSWVSALYAAVGFGSAWIAAFDVWHHHVGPRRRRADGIIGAVMGSRPGDL